MKPNTHRKAENTTPFTRRVRSPREGEIAIDARLLYSYVGHPTLPYERWEESLFPMTTSGYYPLQFELLKGVNGDLSLNLEFAGYSAGQSIHHLAGIVAWILVSEGREAAATGDLDYTNRMLREFEILASDSGLTHAESLHRFLGVEEAYGEWIANLKVKHSMVYRRDYVCLTNEPPAPPLMHKKDTGVGDVLLTARVAMGIAEAEPTKRGEVMRRIQECRLTYHKQSRQAKDGGRVR